MKKFKKLTSLTISIALCFSSLTALNSNAIIYHYLDKNSEEYQTYFAGFTVIDDYGMWNSVEWPDNPDPNPYKIYCNIDIPGVYIYEEYLYNMFTFTVPASIEVSDSENIVQTILDEIDLSYEIKSALDGNGDTVWTVYDKSMNQDTIRNVKIICSELKEQGLISEFIYYGDVTYPLEITCPYLTAYCSSNIDNETIKEVLENYVAESNLDCQVIEVERSDTETLGVKLLKDSVCVVPNYKVSLQEHFKLSKQIYDATGYSPSGVVPASINPTYATTYDLYNAKYGDINDDTNVTPVDASLLLNYYTEAQSDIDHESDSAIEFIGDMNNDGEITPIDAALILEQYAYEQTTLN